MGRQYNQNIKEKSMSTITPKKTAVVFSHCHWDIEWYLPFRAFRFWLVDILNTLQTYRPPSGRYTCAT
jgi:hypothetical protein